MRISPDTVQENRTLRQLVGERYVDIIGLTSEDGVETRVFTADHKLISVDRIHLTYHGAREFGRHVFRHPLLADLL